MHRRHLAALAVTIVALGATAPPATSKPPRIRCAELTALVRGAWFAAPGPATRCGHLTGKRWHVEGRRWTARLTVRGRAGDRFATEVVYRARPLR